MQRLPLGTHRADQRGRGGRLERRVGAHPFELGLDAAAEHDVGAAAGHVGGDGDHRRAPRLGHDLGLLGVLLGVEHLVLQPVVAQQVGQHLGVLDRRGPDQHRLAALEAVADILQDRTVLLVDGTVDLVLGVDPDHLVVGRDDHGFEAVDLLELVGLGVGGASHARQLGVHPEVILEGPPGAGPRTSAARPSAGR